MLLRKGLPRLAPGVKHHQAPSTRYGRCLWLLLILLPLQPRLLLKGWPSRSSRTSEWSEVAELIEILPTPSWAAHSGAPVSGPASDLLANVSINFTLPKTVYYTIVKCRLLARLPGHSAREPTQPSNHIRNGTAVNAMIVLLKSCYNIGSGRTLLRFYSRLRHAWARKHIFRKWHISTKRSVHSSSTSSAN